MVVPSGWLLVPESSRSSPFSVALITSSAASVLIPMTGVTVFTTTSSELLPVLPDLSVTETSMVQVPSVSPCTTDAGRPRLQFPAASTTVV